MPSDKLPALNFYIGDWRKDIGVQSLPYHERGIWFEIICLMHESEQRGKLILNGKPMTEEALARLLGLDKQILSKALSSILEAGVASIEPDTGVLVCRRMVRDENIRKIRSECGKKGGHPLLVKQNASKSQAKPNQNTEDEIESEDVHENVPSSGEGCREGGTVNMASYALPEPTQEEWLTYAQSIGYDPKEAQITYDQLVSTGWEWNGTVTRDWRALCRTKKARFDERKRKEKTNGKYHQNPGNHPRNVMSGDAERRKAGVAAAVAASVNPATIKTNPPTAQPVATKVAGP